MNHVAVTNPKSRADGARRGNNLRMIGRYLLIVAVLVSAYVWLESSGIVDALSGQGGDLRGYVDRFGHAGPLVLMSLMTVAVVVSPLPSAPIALAAGALYGHFWGTLYVVIGAQSGALIAFAIARYLRPERIRRWLDGVCTFRRYDSQNTLMLAVFASRLAPFISFDAASYAAGLTPLATWRFAVATLLGILPASFVLAHFGGEAATGGATILANLFLVLVLLGGAIVLIRLLRGRMAGRSWRCPVGSCAFWWSFSSSHRCSVRISLPSRSGLYPAVKRCVRVTRSSMAASGTNMPTIPIMRTPASCRTVPAIMSTAVHPRRLLLFP